MRRDAAATRQNVLDLAANGAPPAEISRTLSIAPRTVRGHLHALRDELRALGDERIGALHRRALDVSSQAIQVLLEIMTDPAAPPMVRTNAAGRVLEISIRL